MSDNEFVTSDQADELVAQLLELKQCKMGDDAVLKGTSAGESLRDVISCLYRLRGGEGVAVKYDEVEGVIKDVKEEAKQSECYRLIRMAEAVLATLNSLRGQDTGRSR